jgi:predicted ATPase/DNA-binding XRE family transcriptional regulator
VGTSTPSQFGELLNEHRLSAGLTQEALAEQAGVSVRSIQALERGESRPHQDTMQRLATALGLVGEARGAFVAAALPAPRQRFAGRATTTDSDQAARTNLPLQLSSFVGRTSELAEMGELFARTRLLTLTGPGGVGKTRLALQLAADLLEGFPQGVWLVELARLTDPALVPQAVATVLGLQESARRPLMTTLVEALRARRLLLVLDNCEHLLEACAELAEALLRACPHLRILASSREALGLAGETSWRVPSLALPPAAHQPTLEQAAQGEAVQLFVERARAVQPHFALTAQNASTVVQVCRRLDGIPLALELAAARVRGLGVEDLAARLDQRFRLLTGGSRTALPRQQTLQATVEWSYGLLQPAERLLFERLSVFACGFSLPAAEAVCVGGEIGPDAVLDLLLRLVDKSLVQVEDGPDGAAWYRLLETLRQYGQERLAASQDVPALRERHVAYYLQLAEQAWTEMWTIGSTWPAWVERELDNLRAAMAWCLDATEADQPSAEQGLRIAAALVWFWIDSVHRREGLRWLERPTPPLPTTVRASARLAASVLAYNSGEQARGVALIGESVALYRELGDREGLALALAEEGQYLRGEWCGETSYPQTYARGTALLEEGITLARRVGKPALLAVCLLLFAASAQEPEYPQAQAAAEEGLQLAQHARSAFWTGTAHRVLGWLALQAQDYPRAYASLTAALSAHQAVGGEPGVAVVLSYLGDAAHGRGDDAEAAARYEESLALYRELDTDKEHMARVLCRLGDLALEQGDHMLAHDRYAESLRAAQVVSSPLRTAAALEALGRLAVLQQRPQHAMRLAGAATALRERTGQLLSVVEQAALTDALAPAVEALSPTEQAAAWSEGQAMLLEQVIAGALT